MKWKNEALDFLNDLRQSDQEIIAVAGLEKCLEHTTYESWLRESNKRINKEYCDTINRVPSKSYFFIRKNDNHLIGMISIRFNLTEKMLKYFGHISYCIAPSERRKGYSKVNLYLALFKARELGLSEVIISCEVDNLASNRTILSLGGNMIHSIFEPKMKVKMNVYRMDITETLNRY